jgi:hypothetical protein
VANRDWTRRHQAEMLMQLRADVDSALGRLSSQYIRYGAGLTDEQRAEWINRMERVEELRKWAIDDIERFVSECCKEVK